MKMRNRKTTKRALIGLAGVTLFAVPTIAQAPGALAGLQTGMWQLRALSGGAGGSRNICIRNAAQFVQLGHEGQNCRQRVLNDRGNSLSVRYECSGNGWGQTDVTVETPRLARIDTQGIRRGAPFNRRYEARRTGSCS